MDTYKSVIDEMLGMGERKVKHYPVPWHLGPAYKFDVHSAKGKCAEGSPAFSQQGEANAEFIVRAVNSYTKLTEALEKIASCECMAPSWCLHHPSEHCVVCIAKEALKNGQA